MFLDTDQCMHGAKTADRCTNRIKYWHKDDAAPWAACEKHHVKGDQRIPNKVLSGLRIKRIREESELIKRLEQKGKAEGWLK